MVSALTQHVLLGGCGTQFDAAHDGASHDEHAQAEDEEQRRFLRLRQLQAEEVGHGQHDENSVCGECHGRVDEPDDTNVNAVAVHTFSPCLLNRATSSHVNQTDNGSGCAVHLPALEDAGKNGRRTVRNDKRDKCEDHAPELLARENSQIQQRDGNLRRGVGELVEELRDP